MCFRTSISIKLNRRGCISSKATTHHSTPATLVINMPRLRLLQL